MRKTTQDRTGQRRRLLTGAAVSLAMGALATPAWAQVQATNTASDAPVASSPLTDSSDDIIVTATKRNETLRNVALPISAVTGEQLAKANANSLADYVTRLPGVVFNDYQPGVSEVVIRGVAATTYHEQGQTTTGYYLNEIPLVEPGFPLAIPDIDTFDLDRVEVLRGPQGTLFGSSTLGGLINYVVKTADASGIHAAAQSLIGSTNNANGTLNYAGKVMLNVPIIADKLAVRVMALQRFDAGYIDNTQLGVLGANDFRTRGLRGSIVWTPSTATKITYLATYQDNTLDDQTYVQSPDALVRRTPVPERQYTDFLLNSLRAEQDLGFATATVFGSVSKKTNETTYYYGNSIAPGLPYLISPNEGEANIKQVEGRLTSSGNGPLRWLIGASYLRATKNSTELILAPGAAQILGQSVAPGDVVYSATIDTENKDLGIFGEVAWRPVPELELLVGGRYYNTRAAGSVFNPPTFLQGGAVNGNTIDQKEDGFTPKATISFRPTKGFLAYVTYSQGYRVGGINPNAGLLPVPSAFGSDTIDNYEAGVKFGLFDNRLLLDATVFSLDWKGIQARLYSQPEGFSFVSNAADANIAGVELSATLKVARRLTLSSNATYQDSALTSFLPDPFAQNGQGGYRSGTTLPGSSRWSVANNIALDFPDLKVAPTFEIAHRYLSKAPVAFDSVNTRGNYNLFDARAGITVFERFRLLGFVNNVFDKRGILNAPFTSNTAPAYSVTRPRTYGLRIDVGF